MTDPTPEQIGKYLQETGAYVTNDKTRKAAISEAVGQASVAYNAVIDYMLNAGSTEDPMSFLRCWNEGNFDALRKDWPDAPPEIYLADPLSNPPPAFKEAEERYEALSMLGTWWAMNEAQWELDGMDVEDHQTVLHFSGCGASTMVTVGQFRRIFPKK